MEKNGTWAQQLMAALAPEPKCAEKLSEMNVAKYRKVEK